ncbi:MAG: peptidoglycan-associated lipoprotein Pal [Moraxella sp.]|jgi:peptidoglycan-associated lipoprotein
MKLNFLQLLAASAVLSSLALTGCATKRTGTSEVVVAPMGVPAGTGYYNGGAVVTNTTSVVTAANSNPNTVYFGFDSSDIDSQGQAVLNQQAQFLQNNAGARVAIAGHTDERGSREYNMALGERRAKSAAAYLSSQGVASSRIETISYGEDQPVDTAQNEAAWAKNRRAELSY